MSASITDRITGGLPERPYFPTNTLKCFGRKLFRSQVARDAACLFDIDPEVESWVCRPLLTQVGDLPYHCDFSVLMRGGCFIHYDVYDRQDLVDPAEVIRNYWPDEVDYRVIRRDELEGGHRLQNARDLIRYGSRRTPLGDRIGLLRALDEEGSLPVSDCLNAFRETMPMAGLANLILGGFVEVDLDEAPLGPETLVRRIRD